MYGSTLKVRKYFRTTYSTTLYTCTYYTSMHTFVYFRKYESTFVLSYFRTKIEYLEDSYLEVILIKYESSTFEGTSEIDTVLSCENRYLVLSYEGNTFVRTKVSIFVLSKVRKYFRTFVRKYFRIIFVRKYESTKVLS